MNKRGCVCVCLLTSQRSGLKNGPGIWSFECRLPQQLHFLSCECNLFVCISLLQTAETELKQYFSAFGPVKDAKIIADRAGVSKGWLFSLLQFSFCFCYAACVVLMFHGIPLTFVLTCTKNLSMLWLVLGHLSSCADVVHVLTLFTHGLWLNRVLCSYTMQPTCAPP